MPFPNQDQEEKLWCWAAVAVDVDHYMTPQTASTQCLVACAVLKSTQCCANGDRCNQPAPLAAALRKLQIRSRVLNHPLSVKQLHKRLSRNLPVCARIRWAGGSRHFVVITGLHPTPKGSYVVDIIDPFYPEATMLYETFRTAYLGRGVWEGTILVLG
ncbi:MAG TPA: papain-like cysteine protease family protein [Bryobacteraceae bacterium]|jgi:phage tail sheath protein FI|nr:papain-like cysteine protease family protein [Bryobacteraceae bacterium]